MGLDHVVVRTPDPERAAALYGARLGLDMRLDRSNPAWGARLMFFRCGDLIVEIAHDLTAGVSSGPDRLWGLSWRVPDAASTRTRLEAAGLDVSEVHPGRKPGTRVFTVRDRTCGVPTLVLEPGVATT
jgi:catechol 2,3-dioxygenase-like lactoylglutathione lyase family enzyme